MAFFPIVRKSAKRLSAKEKTILANQAEVARNLEALKSKQISKRYPWQHPRIDNPAQSQSKGKTNQAKYDRSYIPVDLEARKRRKLMLEAHDLGINQEAFAQSLASQEGRHQNEELIKLAFGDIGERQYLIELLVEAHIGSQEAMDNWLEIAHSAAVHLRMDGILQDMQKALDAVANAFRRKTGPHKKNALIASLFALNYKAAHGTFPEKNQVVTYLKSKDISLPDAKNLHRFWNGPVLGRLMDGKAGRKPIKKVLKLPSKIKNS